MSVGSELDVDVQDLVHVVVAAAMGNMGGWSEAGALDVRTGLLDKLLKMGWLPPTYTAHVAAKVKQAWEAEGDDEAFEALNSAANTLDVELVDPMADPLNSVTLNPMTLGKVA